MLAEHTFNFSHEIRGINKIIDFLIFSFQYRA
jgi:hypothetical protein